MCGLILQVGDRSDREDIIIAGLDAMKHRGESQTTWKDKNFAVGHRRLAITDIKSEGHPYEFEGSLIWCVGEYYDAPSNMSDTLELLKSFGQRTLPIPGMYTAFLKPSNKSGNMVIITDRLGKKPLYHRTDTDTYASEIKALTTPALPPVTLDVEYLGQCVGAREFGNRTPYNEIKRVPPGYHNLRPNGLSFHTSYQPFLGYPYSSRFNDAVKRAVLKRIPAEVNYHILLSGGLDSSIVYKIIQDHLPGVVEAIHYEQEDDKMGKILSDRLGDSVYNIKEVWEDGQGPSYEELLAANEGPLDLGSLIPQFKMLADLRENCQNTKVLITGDGADELFWGYKRAKASDTKDFDMAELYDWHLPRLDKIGMWFGYEIRCPFLDDEVQRHAHFQDWHVHSNKFSLRSLARDLDLEPHIINRPKVPLKSPQIKQSKKTHQANLVEAFADIYPTGIQYEY